MKHVSMAATVEVVMELCIVQFERHKLGILVLFQKHSAIGRTPTPSH